MSSLQSCNHGRGILVHAVTETESSEMHGACPMKIPQAIPGLRKLLIPSRSKLM